MPDLPGRFSAGGDTFEETARSPWFEEAHSDLHLDIRAGQIDGGELPVPCSPSPHRTTPDPLEADGAAPV